jgi:predicted dienelactone hydrolase
MRKTLLLALGASLCGAAFAAQDPCLGGASLLGDERALASLRTSTESTCPCATFTGAPGMGRAAYQSCARGVLRDALAKASLRRQCKLAATRTNRGAVCGSSKVACGRFSSRARVPETCHLKPTARCHDARGFTGSACTNETHCADVVDWTAGTCVDARDDGPFVPGVRVISFTKPSAVNPAVDRVLDTIIWYPAAPGSGPINMYGGVLDAPVDTSKAAYPLLLFSHGSCGYPAQSQFLTPLLASYGFIVVAPPHPGNTISDFPTCGSSQAQINSAVERPKDMIFVLDQMLAANGDPGSPFHGTIDPARVGMSGHSFGGLTTYLVAAQDSRVKIAMPLAPAVPGSPVLHVPSLHMLGQIDAVVNVPAIRTAYANADAPKYLVEIKNIGHYAFSDGCFPSPDCNPPITLTQAEAHDLVRRWVLPFLKVYLAGDASFAPQLTPQTSPAVVLTAKPQ